MSHAINEISTQHLRRDDGEVIDTRPNWQQWLDACALGHSCGLRTHDEWVARLRKERFAEIIAELVEAIAGDFRGNRANTVGILGSLISDALRRDGGQQ
jgi:hypothetical protein